MRRIFSILLPIALFSLVFICSAVSKNRDADSAEFDADLLEEIEMTNFNFINFDCGYLRKVKKINDCTTKIVIGTKSKPILEYHMLLEPYLFRYGYIEGDTVWFIYEVSTASYPPSYSKLRPVFIFRSGLVDRAKILDPGIRKLLK